MQGQGGFWDVEDRLKELSAEGDPLQKLAATVDFEMFRPVLRAALGRSAGGKAPLQQSLLEYDDTSMGCGGAGAS